MKTEQRILLSGGEELQLLSSTSPAPIECKPFRRRDIIRMLIISSCAWIVVGIITLAVYIWGLYAIGLMVFITMVIIAALGVVDAIKSLRKF